MNAPGERGRTGAIESQRRLTGLPNPTQGKTSPATRTLDRDIIVTLGVSVLIVETLLGETLLGPDCHSIHRRTYQCTKLPKYTQNHIHTRQKKNYNPLNNYISMNLTNYTKAPIKIQFSSEGYLMCQQADTSSFVWSLNGDVKSQRCL